MGTPRPTEAELDTLSVLRKLGPGTVRPAHDVRMDEDRRPDSLFIAANSSDFVGRVRRLLKPSRREEMRPRGISGSIALLIAVGLLTISQLTAQNDLRAEEAPQADAAATQDGGNKNAQPLTSSRIPVVELTPAMIADRIEVTMKQFTSVEYSAEIHSVRNTNAWQVNAEPVLVEGSGQVHYRSDGSRWYVDEDTFTYRQGDSSIMPRKNVAGFDGSLHYSVDRFVNLGSEDLSNARLEPRAVFWHGAKTDGWLLSALRRQEARVVRDQNTIKDGRRVVDVTSEWKQGEQQWRYEISVLPDHSWLPLSTRVFLNDENVATEVIEELASNDAGTWYPARIKWTQKVKPYVTFIRQTTVVKSFSIRNDFTDSEFRYSPSFGTAITDHRQGVTWYHDPWWSELAPWIKEQFGWPEPGLSAIRELQSYADKKTQGQPAPPIQAAEWLNDNNPGPWDRTGRRTTVLFFFGGRAIPPTPKYMVALKALHSRYKDRGLEVIGVVTSNKEPERTRQAMQELQVSFPVAIDSPNADGKGYGRTFAAYGLRSYVGVFVIDPAGIVHLVNPADVSEGTQISALEHVLKTLAQGAVEVDTSSRQRLPDAAAQKIGEEWKRRAALKNGTAKISGRIEATADDRDVFIKSRLASRTRSGAAALVQATPVFQILPQARPSVAVHSMTATELLRLRPMTMVPSNSPACAVVNIIAPGLARTERTITLANDKAEADVSLVLNQGDVISGTVVDSAGMPIVGATIAASKRHFDPIALDRETNAHLPETVTTTAEGRFKFRNLYVGAYTFHVTASGFETRDAQPIAAGTQNAQIVLQKNGESKD